MSIFSGRIIIYQGGKSSGFRNSEEVKDGDKLGDNVMLQIRSFGQFNTKAIQVEFSASTLNSNDVFIIYTKTSTYCWFGKGSTGDEREAAKLICNGSKREPISVFETQEKDDFWNVLGGKLPYSNDKRLQTQLTGTQAARLFEISNASGKINVQEIFQFTQVTDTLHLVEIN
jgi:hypothetical protein